ncbi:exo-alpha-sialidase [Phytomonospora sp. NPDC050363]|uniref:golvesin C-terminal-like domain-containing protein n=1 Tax=Phytomonospora sp. NPDC050363 TaxID=3155642 RepID=UPI003411D993
MIDPKLPRRTLLGAAVAATATVALARPAQASAAGRARPFFDEKTLWDAEVDPLVNYHVHGLCVLADDTILVATEGRHEVCDAGPRDLVLRRSPDGGETWLPTQTIVESVDGQSWGNPAFVVDAVTGEVFLFYMLSVQLPENTTCSGDSGDLFVVSSTDAGATWGEPRSLAGMFDHFGYEWALHNPGPGHGLQLDSGRLLLNVSHRRIIVGTPVDERYYGLASIYSDDHGATWHTTAEVPVSVDYPANEARMFRRADGTIAVNARAASGGNRQRIVAVSGDDGLTWSAPVLDGATGVFNAVDAGLLRYSGVGDGEPDRVLFSRPDAPMRWNMTVSVSYDGGHSFRYRRVVNENRSYYSDLARLSDGTVVLVYGCEGDIPSFPRKVNVARFNLEWLTAGRDGSRHGPRLSERVYPLAELSKAATVVGGTLETVEEATARGRSRLVLRPSAAEAYVDIPFTVHSRTRAEAILRYFRPVDGGVLTATIDGRRLHNTTADTTAESSGGYDLLHLGETDLRPGRHVLRLALTGPGRGGGTVISADTLSLVTAPHPADLREEATVDNSEQGFQVLSGTWATATGTPGYYGGNYRSAAAGTGASVVRFRPSLPADGEYEVRVSYTAHANRATNAPYTVHHANGSHLILVDQTEQGEADVRTGQWTSLGVFTFKAGVDSVVELSDLANGVVIADAVRFLRVA